MVRDKFAVTWTSFGRKFETFVKPKRELFPNAYPKTVFYPTEAEAWSGWKKQMLQWAEQSERRAAELRETVEKWCPHD